MQEKTISLKTAQLAIKAGADKDFNSILDVPQSLLQKWLRVKHGIIVEVCLYADVYNFKIIKLYEKYVDEPNKILHDDFEDYKEYEDALESGLQKAHEFLKTI